MDTTVKLDLLEHGTRYDHYMELKEAFATGIVLLENALKTDNNALSRANVVKLSNAVELIDSRIGYLSEYNRKTAFYGDLAKEVRAIPPNRPAELPEVSETTRLECEKEMQKARESGYAKDDSQANASPNQGTSPQEPK